MHMSHESVYRFFFQPAARPLNAACGEKILWMKNNKCTHSLQVAQASAGRSQRYEIYELERGDESRS